MHNHYKLKEGVSTQEILYLIEGKDWDVDRGRQNRISVQKETSTIHIKKAIARKLSKAERRNHLLWPGSEYDKENKTVFWHKYQPVRDFFAWFQRKYGGDICRVNLVRLYPEGHVKEHIDGGRYYKDKDRFHLVIQGEYQYTVDKEPMIYKQGELWWFDNKKIHESTNTSAQERIALIFDVKECNWREQIESF